MMHVLTVLGARPQFIKAAPVCFALRRSGLRETLVHTGQHYDEGMSEIFFRELGIPAPDVNLGIGSGPHGAQTAAMLDGIERLLLTERPDLVLVYGDTNSTLAGALAASKLGLPLAHVEAGLRSFNRTMPEEINRVIADHCATLLFCPTSRAVENLRAENITRGVHQVGDTMFDAVRLFTVEAEKRSRILTELGLVSKGFYLATIHRPYTTDDPRRLAATLQAFGRLDAPVVFPIHPRTSGRLQAFGIAPPDNVRTIAPVGYFDMLMLQRHARVILTDSGGVQKEACFAGTPCVTVRPETEWTETVDSGWNRLAWGDADTIVEAVARQQRAPAMPVAAYGDGHAADAIVACLVAAIPASMGAGASEPAA
jgi:UDP-N-acetylglucosamine 2-epimerase